MKCPKCKGRMYYDEEYYCHNCGAALYPQLPALGKDAGDWNGTDSEKALPRYEICRGVDCLLCPREWCVYDRKPKRYSLRRVTLVTWLNGYWLTAAYTSRQLGWEIRATRSLLEKLVTDGMAEKRRYVLKTGTSGPSVSVWYKKKEGICANITG